MASFPAPETGQKVNIHPTMETTSVKYPNTSFEPSDTLVNARQQNKDEKPSE
jgi:hypothetical protein